MLYTIKKFEHKNHMQLRSVINSLVNISNQCFEKFIAYDEDDFYFYLANHHLMLLRDEQDGIQGLCLYGSSNIPDAMHVFILAVMPSARGHNFGYLMIKRALEAAQEKVSVPLGVTLHCRPRNESYYKRMGFFVYQPPIPDYYHVSNPVLPGINMMATQLRFDSQRKPKQAQTNELNLANDLIRFIIEIKQSTSFWYSNCFHSARKDQAFEAIHQELLATRTPGMQINQQQAEEVLRAIISNSLIIRGILSGKYTASATKALTCLNSENFLRLKNIISDAKQLTLDDLLQFSELKQQHSQSFVGEYPYCHFYKQKSNSSQSTPSTAPLPAAITS